MKLDKIFMPKPQGVKSLGLRFGNSRLAQRFDEARGSLEGTFLLNPQVSLSRWRANGQSCEAADHRLVCKYTLHCHHIRQGPVSSCTGCNIKTKPITLDTVYHLCLFRGHVCGDFPSPTSHHSSYQVRRPSSSNTCCDQVHLHSKMATFRKNGRVSQK